MMMYRGWKDLARGYMEDGDPPRLAIRMSLGFHAVISRICKRELTVYEQRRAAEREEWYRLGYPRNIYPRWRP